MTEYYRFAAFISYSSKDSEFARRLHRALEAYRIPNGLGSFDLLGGGGKRNRIYPVFRDREEMSAGDLGERIEAALRTSGALIVVCTRDSAASPWVQKEIEYFIGIGRSDRILTVIPDKATSVSDVSNIHAYLPPPLVRSSAGEPREPFVADARRGQDGFRGALLRLVAGLIQVNTGRLVDRDKARRVSQTLLVAALVVALAVTLIVGGSWALSSRLHERAKTLAELARQASEQGLSDRAARYALAGLRGANLWPRFDAGAPEAELRRAGAELRLFAVLDGKARSLDGAEFSLDGRRVLTSSFGETARVWNAETGEVIATLYDEKAGIVAAHFSPDASKIVTSLNNSREAQVVEVSTGKVLATLRNEDWNWILDARFRPDGKQIVTSCVRNTPRVWDASTGNILFTLRGHTGPVPIAIFSPDGRRILTASAPIGDSTGDRTARIWDVVSGRQVEILELDKEIRGASFSADGSRVLIVASSTAHIWDVGTGVELARMTGDGDFLDAARFSPDGRFIAAIDRTVSAVESQKGESIRVWDTSSGREIATIQGHLGWITGLEFSPAGERLASASRDATVRVWETKSGLELAVLRGHTDWVNTVHYSPDSKIILTASKDGTARLWRNPEGRSIGLAKHNGFVGRSAFSADGSRVLTRTVAETWISDVSNGRQIARLGYGFDNSVVSRDGAYLLVWAEHPWSRLAWVYDTSSGSIVTTLIGHEGAVIGGAFSSDGLKVVTYSSDVNDSCGDKTARVWETVSGRQIAILEHSSGVAGASFDQAGNQVLTASGDARLWNARTGKGIRIFRVGEGRVTNVAFGAEGKSVLISIVKLTTNPELPTTYVFDAQTGAELISVQGETGQRYLIGTTFTPDRTHFTTCCKEEANSGGTRVMWSVDGRPVAEWSGSAVYSNNSRLILTWDDRSRVAQLLEQESGRLVAKLVDLDAGVTAAVFSKDDTRIALGLENGAVRVWDTASARQLATLRGFSRRINSVEFSNDGNRVIAGSYSGARIWTLNQALVEPLDPLVSRICSTSLPGSLAEFTPADLDRAPMLSAVYDRDVCSLPSLLGRLSILFP